MRLFEIKSSIPAGLLGLAAEARKAPTFDDFKKDFLIQIKHGTYWHLTSDPNFFIDENKGPRDLSSMSGGDSMEVGKLMITSDLDNWNEHYGKARPYAALIDMSNVPRSDYRQVSRGFGNELWVENPSQAKVIKVMPIAAAKRLDKRRHALLPQSEKALRDFYNTVNS